VGIVTDGTRIDAVAYAQKYVELGSVDLLILDNHVKPGKLFNDVFDTCIIEY
jgi:hypothetical protein